MWDSRIIKTLIVVGCAFGVTFSVGVWLQWNYSASRSSELQVKRELTDTVVMSGAMRSLAKEVALRAAIFNDARPGQQAATSELLKKAIDTQALAASRLSDQLAEWDQRNGTRFSVEFQPVAQALSQIRREAAAILAGTDVEARLTSLVETSSTVVDLITAYNKQLMFYMQATEERHEDAQSIIRRIGAGLLGTLILVGLSTALVLQNRTNRKLRLTARDLQVHADDLVSISQLAKVGSWRLEFDPPSIHWSDQVRTLFEVAPDFVPTPESTKGFLRGEAQEKLNQIMARAVEAREPWDIELEFVTARNRVFWGRSIGRPVVEDGRVVALSGAFQDVSEQMVAAQHHRFVQERLSIATVNGNIGLWDWNPQTGASWYNATWWTMLGYDPDASEPNSDLWISLMHPDDAPIVQNLLDAHLRGETDIYRSEFRLRCDDGTWKWISASGRIVERDDLNRPIRVSGVHIDISSRKAIEESLTGANTHLKAVIDNFPGGLSLLDSNLRYAAWNEKFHTLLGHSRELFVDRCPTLEEVLRASAGRTGFGPGNSDEEIKAWIQSIREGGAVVFEHAMQNGTVLEICRTPIANGGIVTTFMDITARKKVEADLINSRDMAEKKTAELEITLRHMNQGLSVFDQGGRLILWNQQYIDIFGMDPALACVGTSIDAILEERQRRSEFKGNRFAYIQEFKARLARGEDIHTTFRLANGRVIASLAAPIPGGGWVSTHQDITDREEAAARVVYAAHHDVLTGLANRAEIKKRIAEALVERQRTLQPFGLFLVDLDRFKAVNDTFGHDTGDRVLQEVARRMSAIVRADDIVARLGGDEFAILYRAPRNVRETAAALAKRLLEQVSTPYEIDGRIVHIGVSIGIAVAPADGDEVDSLLRSADAALYRVKADGRNAYRFFDAEIEAAARDRRELERDLREAVANEQLTLHYQPIVALAGRRTVGVEALLRWTHPVRGMIRPDHFIPIAEETGLIGAIGDWVIQRACLDAARWPSDITVAVNVSAAQLGRGQLVASVSRAIMASGIRPSQLEIEVTESIFLRNDDALLTELHELHELGVRLALDDFGTGYSSLGYLRLLPFDKIKIDRTFVADLADSRHCSAIICAVTSLARSLDIETTAEGVENTEQLQLLTAAGCTHVQGYLFSPPVPFEKVPLMVDGEALPLMKVVA